MNFTIPIYQCKESGSLEWTTLGLGEFTSSKSGRTVGKVRQGLTDMLKKTIRSLKTNQLDAFTFNRGISLQRIHLELTLRSPIGKRKPSGRFPLILEPRWANETSQIVLAYHPLRQKEWFPVDPMQPLDEQATLYFQKVWAELQTSDLDNLKTNGKDRISALAFSTLPQTLLDLLPRRKKGIWDDLEPTSKDKKKRRKKRGFKVLRELGTDLTQRVVDAQSSGQQRSPYREKINAIFSGKTKRSFILVGPPGVGKNDILKCFVYDLLYFDNYSSHRNLDRVHHVWSVAGKRLIAGMSYLGDWEKRCIELLDDASSKWVILNIEDLYAFGRIGRSRDSDRSLSDLFISPVSRREVTVVSCCTSTQLRQLEDDAPSLASLFTVIRVDPTPREETMQLLLLKTRELECKHTINIDPRIYPMILSLGDTLFPSHQFPGKGLNLLEELVRNSSGSLRKANSVIAEGDKETLLGPRDLLDLLSKTTGLPVDLIQPEKPLSFNELYKEFSSQVMGQEDAVSAMSDLVLRIRTGLNDERRPYGVFLFTGPTGTGKTELAKSLTEVLYSDQSALVRIDLSEYNTPETASRLIGDYYQPEGRLTQPLLEHPFCVVLLDEIDKAHPSVLNLLLQLLDEGRLTDSAGNTADFTHSVVILTSNLGQQKNASLGFIESSETEIRHNMAQEVKQFFPPELFNRIDKVIYFQKLSRKVALTIANKELMKLLGRRGLTAREVHVTATKRVLSRIVNEGFDPQYGARTLKRYLDDQIGTLLAGEITSVAKSWIRVLRLYDNEKGLQIYSEHLGEVETRDEDWSLEPFINIPIGDLMKELPTILNELDKKLDQSFFDGLAKKIRFNLKQHSGDNSEDYAERAYYLDELRNRLKWLRGRMGYLYSTRRFDRDHILDCLAEKKFLERAELKVDHLPSHTIFIELKTVGWKQKKGLTKTSGLNLLRTLAEFYADYKPPQQTPQKTQKRPKTLHVSYGELEDVAVVKSDNKFEYGLKRFPQCLDDAQHVVLKIEGLSVLDYFEGEQGSHIWQSLEHGTQICRVRIFPLDKKTEQIKTVTTSEKQNQSSEISALDIIKNYSSDKLRFQEALEKGLPNLPYNPECLLPAVRKIRYDLPTQKGEHVPIDVEDYFLGYSTTIQGKGLAQILPILFQLRMSRNSDEK